MLLLPSVALLVGIAISSMERLFATTKTPVLKRIPVVLAIFALVWSAYGQKEFLFRLSPAKISRAVYGVNPFPESLEIARYIDEHSAENERIAVIGSEPQIYFYSNRRAATRYIYMYPLMELHDYAVEMQKEMISEIESANPKYLVYVRVSASWLVRPGSVEMIFKWFDSYRSEYYELVGIAEILSESVVETLQIHQINRISGRGCYIKEEIFTDRKTAEAWLDRISA